MFFNIVDEDITLKLLTNKNAGQLFNIIDKNREFLKEWLPWIDSKKTVEDIQSSIDKWGNKYISNTAINAGIFFKGELVGMVAFPEIDWQGKKTSFGYWLSPGFEGKGIVIRCVENLTDYAFNTLNLNRIEISCAEDNLRSRALPEKLGFIKEGILRDNYYLNGYLHNLIVYSLLKSDWEKAKYS
ncbi:GNAT family N-acetyltransferase [Bacillus lacus]|uniref:GNAT family N-acetyltransferase n=1 Tax=Metabacillus lacus TaxID=1983721 RepID=A0A7X2IXK0_9BACI|nr:GNAT family protein [Metabacillus lacus]MRX71516.1 GNAT family N-acetyltransferase [Metabacillus lacus]